MHRSGRGDIRQQFRMERAAPSESERSQEFNHREAIMIQETIRIRLPVSRIKEAMAILRPLVESTKTVPGCVDCELYRDVLEDTVLVFHDLWDDEEGLQRHLRSDEYRDLLLVMEMAREVPEVRFDVIAHTSGLEAIERARTGPADRH